MSKANRTNQPNKETRRHPKGFWHPVSKKTRRYYDFVFFVQSCLQNTKYRDMNYMF